MVRETLRENMRSIVRCYARATGKTESAISRQFYGSTAFLEDFYAGRKTISLDKFDAMYEAICAKWPPGAERPTLRPAVMRPPKSVKLSPKIVKAA